jgi:hypothetical protein
MGIHQLFQKKPPLELILKILKSTGINDLNDTTNYFNEIIINSNNCISLVKPLEQELKKYYLVCKHKYISNINFKKLVTILRQLLKTIDYNLIGKTKYFQSKKYTCYYIQKITKSPPKQSSPIENPVISFD